MIKNSLIVSLVMFFLIASGLDNKIVAQAASNTDDYIQSYAEYYPAYVKNDKVLADAFLAEYDYSEAQALVARAIWYMENGYMIYGHTKYWDTGFIDCSNFVSLVYKDFGYTITSASKKYNQVGKKIDGVYTRKISGSSKYELVGTEKLKPGDIFTFWTNDSDGNGTHIGHVALYMGEINGQPAIIQTNSERPTAIGIRTDFRYWYGEHFVEARRVLDESAQSPDHPWQASLPVIPAVYQLPPQNPVIMPEDKFMSHKNTAAVTEPSGSEEDINPSPEDSSENADNSNQDDSPSSGGSSSNTDNRDNEASDEGIISLNDISGHWAEQNIYALVNKNSLQGYPDGSFRPDNMISRAEFVTALVRSFNLDADKTDKVFSDTSDHWAVNTIAEAAGQGIISGYTESLFGPDDPVTREQMAVMLIKAAQLNIEPQTSEENTFTDSDQISAWAKTAVLTAHQKNIMCGYPNKTFQSQKNASRAEAVTAIINALKANQNRE